MPHTTSPLSGSLEPGIKQQIASQDKSHLQAHLLPHSQPLPVMDQLSIPKAIPRVPQTQLQLLTQMLHPTFPTILLLHQNQSQLIIWMPYFKCKGTDPFCKHISRRLLNGKAPHHKFDTFNHAKGLLYKHIMDAGKKFLTLVIPKLWKYTVLVEAHDNLGHQGNSHTYCLIKCQYYWKGMNKDIQKYIANCVLCQ